VYGALVSLGALLALALPAAADARNPLAPGKLSVKSIEYEAGSIAVTVPGGGGEPDQTFLQPLEGSVTYPSGPGPWPLLLFLHGRHATCITADGQETVPEAEDPDVSCPDLFAPDGRPLQTKIRSYAGYDYLASLLASRGYAVVSPSANVIASFDGGEGDGGTLARTQVIGATLDLMRRWNNGAGPRVAGAPSRSVGTKLTGRLELQRVGLMGHSRGGDGVAQYIAHNARRAIRYPLLGVVSLAPTDLTERNPFRNGGTNLAELLPACDGDVIDLQGGRVFERVKYARGGRPFTKVQWLVEGANHNYYNTVWTDDDARYMPWTAIDSACGGRRGTSTRLTPAEQRDSGQALIGSFLRHFVGHERGLRRFAAGHAYPRAACPSLVPLSCGQLVEPSLVGPRGSRLELLGPGGNRPLSRSAVGTPLRSPGLQLRLCDPTKREGREVRRCPGPRAFGEELIVNRSWTRQLVAGWRGRAALRTSLPRRLRDARRYDTVVLRTATNLSSRNPEPRGNRVRAATQRLDVVLTDRRGRRAVLPAERFSNALQPPVGDRLRQLLLGEVRIPLRRFAGIDLGKLRSVSLRFGVRGRSRGQIQLADMALERRARAPRLLAASAESEPEPGSGTADEGVPLGEAAPARAGCDGAPARLEIDRAEAVGGVVRVAGSARPGACGPIERVVVSVEQRTRFGCRYLRGDGELGPVVPCGAGYGLIAGGERRWRLELPAAGDPVGLKVEVRALTPGEGAAGSSATRLR
jgi:hypothetical protein